ncbi:MAG: helix-turn-helix transcriptional regulator [Azospirillum sp.]|nr:helix-turn-helix transcriptional regulator [Azospirillum sp.]
MAKFDREALYQWRLKHNLTQEQAARAVGVTPGAWRNWEQGLRNISAPTAMLIQKLKPSDLPADRGSAGKRPIGVRARRASKKNPAVEK